MRQNLLFEDRPWLVRIRKGDKPDGSIVGTGFAIDERHILTCAHVVTAAGGSGPGAELTVELPFDGGRRFQAVVLEEAWRAPPGRADPQSRGDTALLRTREHEPPLTPLPITTSRTGVETTISSYGFPGQKPESGVAEGIIGRPVGFDWLRIEQKGSAAFTKGFSGAPAWSDDVAGAVGMIVARDDDQERASYAVPMTAIADGAPTICGALAKTPLAWLDHMRSALDASRIDQTGLIEERTENFVGRAFVFKELDQRIGRPGFRSGYILIEGYPGIGKSSIVARLAATRGLPHHFNVISQNLRSPRAFLTNICAQLISYYDLGRETLPPNVGDDASFLLRLLGEASKKSRNPVLVLLDALDEAEPPPVKGVNKLHLPARLPERCYVVITNRRGADLDIIVDDLAEPIVLNEESDENREDIESYCRLLLAKSPDEADRLLRVWKVGADEFVTTIREKSEGNFMYVRSMVPELLSGNIKAGSLAGSLQDLPKGLIPYYERHWTLMNTGDPERFERLYEPIIRFMGAAKDAVRAEDIAEWMNSSGKFPPITARAVIDVLGKQWRQFVHRELSTQPRYRIYHRSFLDFLGAKVGRSDYERMIADALDAEFDLDAPDLPPSQ